MQHPVRLSSSPLHSHFPAARSAASSRTDGYVATDTCVVTSTTLASSTLGMTVGIITSSNYDNWYAQQSALTVAQSLDLIKDKFESNSICEGTDFSDYSCTTAPLMLSGGETYMIVFLNTDSSQSVTVNAATVTQCTAAQHAALESSSDASRLAQRFIFTLLIAVVSILF